MKPIIRCALAIVACASLAQAQDCACPCDHCGCQSCCRKVCRLVCETKKVPKVTYSCECEDFCVPGKSDRHLACDCDCDCGKKHWVYTPNCAELRTRKKLVKHETMEEKPSYKWVVETVCDSCAGKCAAGDAASVGGANVAAHSLPPMPREALQVHYESPGREPARDAAASAATAATEKRPKSPLHRVFAPLVGGDKAAR